MPRLTLALVALIGILTGGLSVSLLNRPQASLTDDDIRAVVAQELSARANTAEAPVKVAAPINAASLDPAQLNPMIEKYLLDNPRMLERMSNLLKEEMRVASTIKTEATLKTMHEDVYNNPDDVILGNPDGDVTLIEMFDYNCGYCRQALPDIAALLAEDKNLKIILKEFPILSPESIAAARVAVLVAQSDIDYWEFHQKLFSSRGQVSAETALQAAQEMGLNRIELELAMSTEPVSKAIEKSYEIAKALDITGTPSFIIGNEIIPGAIGIEELRKRIANMRACGAATCKS